MMSALTGLVAAVLMGAPAAAVGLSPDLGPQPRIASPDGTSTDCTNANPCSITQAVNGAPDGADVIINPGVYGSPTPLAAALTDHGTRAISVHNSDGKPAPVIHTSAQYGFKLTDSGSSLSHVTVISTGAIHGVLVSGEADHLFVTASHAVDGACGTYGPVSDSVCIGTGDATPGLGYVEGGDLDTSATNVTAIATGAHASALLAQETATGSTLSLTATNSIFKGTKYDADIAADAEGTTTVTMVHSDVATRAPVGFGGGTTQLIDGGGNTEQPPSFVNPAGFDFREKAGSPTVNAGLAQPDDETDAAGFPRTLGSAIDMGGLEFLPPPSTPKLSSIDASHHKIHATVTVNPHGLPTDVVFLNHHGSSTSSNFKAGHGTSPKQIKVVVKGLPRHTTYTIHAVATNAGGKVKSKTTSVHTT
jgi:hypothetical protein